MTKLTEDRVRELIREELANHLKGESDRAQKPMFKRENLKHTGIAINGEIQRRAVEKLKTEKGAVGKSLSQLVEYLLWDYIGRPDDVVEK
jgi:hypothetical protein